MLEIRRRPSGILQIGVTRRRRHRPGARAWHALLGRSELVAPDGSVLWAGDWEENTVHDEGEADALRHWFPETTSAKHLFLLGEATVASRAETDTMTDVIEAETPGTHGYSRPEILPGDWGAVTLDAGDYQITAAQKTFGPNTDAGAWSVSHTGLTTASTGTAGDLLLTVPLSVVQVVEQDISFRHSLTVKAQ